MKFGNIRGEELARTTHSTHSPPYQLCESYANFFIDLEIHFYYCGSNETTLLDVLNARKLWELFFEESSLPFFIAFLVFEVYYSRVARILTATRSRILF